MAETIFNNIKEFLKTRASMDIDDKDTFAALKKISIKTSIMFVFIFISGMITYYISTDTEALQSKLYYYLIIIFVPIITFIFIGKDMFFRADNNSSYEPFVKIALYLGLLFVVMNTIENVRSSATGLVFMNYFINIVFVLIMITGLAIVYFLFSNYIKQQTGAVGVFARILFYLPCLFADFVNYLKKELSITPNVVYLLFLMEIVFVGLYVYLPKWVNKFARMNSNVLLNDPVDLNVETTIAGSNHFLATRLEEMDDSGRESTADKILRTLNRWTNKDKLKENQLYKFNPTYRDNNYSISFWAYVNPGTMSDTAYVRESNILNYANGKPKIGYVNNGTHKGHKYVVYLSNSPNAEPYEIVLDADTQKWNYFTIIYHDHSADLFVNGKLLRSQDFNTSNVPLAGNAKDTIVVGSERGLKGAICNVSYYPYALTQREIATSYNVLRFKNPPILGF